MDGILKHRDYRERLIDREVDELMGVFGAVKIEGPKYCGKTWCAQAHANSEIRLDREETRNLVSMDHRIALEGERVNIDFEKGVVYVNGEALDEPYTLEPTYRRIDFEEELEVPEGCLFVMGDNRNGSTDSRDLRIGCIDERLIMGRALFLVVPGTDIDGDGRDWSRIGFIS